MQNPIQKFRPKSIGFKKKGVFVWKFKNFDELKQPNSSTFSAETWHTFLTYQCLQKGVWDFFKFSLDLDLFSKIKKIPGFCNLVFYIFINNSRCMQNEKNPKHPF